MIHIMANIQTAQTARTSEKMIAKMTSALSTALETMKDMRSPMRRLRVLKVSTAMTKQSRLTLKKLTKSLM